MKRYILLLLTLICICSAPVFAGSSISNGYYVLLPACAPSSSVTIKNGSKSAGANAYLYSNSNSAKQVFLLQKQSDGSYSIKNKKSGLALEAAGTKNSANVRQNTYTGSSNQRWKFVKSGNYYVIKNAASGKALTVKNSASKNGTNIFIYAYQKKSGQKFQLKHIGSGSSKNTADPETVKDSIIPISEIDDWVDSLDGIDPIDDEDDADSIDYFTDSSSSGSSKNSISSYGSSSRAWKDSDYNILINIIGAVESGGQVYGNRNYAAYAGPYACTSNEVTVTLGWAQYYGNEGQKLIQMIKEKDPKTFSSIDKNHLIEKALQSNWVSIRWNPSTTEKNLLIQLITSDTGKKCQDELFKTYMKEFVADCKSSYTSNAWATFMYCEIRHLGGESAARRIFDKCAARKDYSLNGIMSVLKLDQSDSKSSSQVGDSLFWSRHVKCCEFIQTYAK